VAATSRKEIRAASQHDGGMSGDFLRVQGSPIQSGGVKFLAALS